MVARANGIHASFMPLDPTSLAATRPFLYHLTARENLDRIARVGRLDSAARLAVAARQVGLLDARRKSHVAIEVDGESVIIRDQAPLHERNMRLTDGWSFQRFVRHLNERVFFWPGSRSGPISYGERHFARYRPESPVLLRVPTESLATANPQTTLEVSTCNSGSPRWSRGIAAPRGPATFIPLDRFALTAGRVVEVTVVDYAVLPSDTQFASHIGGPWELLPRDRVSA